jgi:Mce-associated membrane protein
MIAVRVEIESAEEQDEAKVTEETARQAADEATDDTEDIAESGDEIAGQADAEDPKQAEPPARKGGIRWSRVVAFGVLPVLALLIAAASGFLDWRGAWIRGSGIAVVESVSAAKDSTVAILSYQSDSVERDLGAAGDRLTGKFKDSYTQLVHDVVIPGAKKDHISAVATVPAAASVSAEPNHAVALVFVDQTVTVGNDASTGTSSTVRVTLDKSGGRWLISAFDPI